jgi:predicted aspartyl protease
MRYPYSRDYYPPAPIIEVTFVTAAESLRVGPLPPALVDSGADGTIVPIDFLDRIHAPSTTEMSIRSHWGESRRILLYLVDVQIGDLTLPGMEVVGDEISTEIVIGRDILNRLQVLLNGPGQTIEVTE